MGTTVKEQTEKILTQAPPSLRKDVPLDNFEHIQIPEDEQKSIINNALYNERKRRHYANETAKYWDAIKVEKNYPEYKPDELAVIVKQRFFEENGRPYIIDQDNRGIFQLLCEYFTANDAFSQHGYDLKKGILLCGDVGRGKTELMLMFRQNQLQSYGVVGCRSITDDFTDNGGEDVERFYTNKKLEANHKYGQPYSGYCFDDLGTEAESVVHYGNRKNMMAEIILNRYDSKMDFHYTHITTNLNAEDIRSRYGSRCADRMRQMFNVIAFPLTAKSRR